MKKKYILPVLFTGAIAIMALLTFFGPHRTYSENEKRVLAESPKLSWQNIMSGQFQDEIETYISDHLVGREFFVGVSAYFDRLLGKNSLNDIYAADGGYLINAPKEDKNDNFAVNISNFQKFSSQCGIKSTLMIVPSAGYIMNDRLPAFHKKYNDSALFEKANELSPGINFFDGRSTLYEEYSKGTEVYYHTDHHLTSEGSYALYTGYCRFANLDFPLKEEYDIEKYDGFYGTTYSGSGYWLNDPDVLEIWDLGLDVTVTHQEKADKTSDTMFFKEHLDKMDMYPVFLDGNHSYVKISNPHAKKGNLLLIRDSFAQNMAPFLAYNYKNIHMLDMRYYRSSVTELIDENDIDEILYLYGIDTLITDKSSNWLFF